MSSLLSCLDFPGKSLLLDSACLNCSEDIHLSLTSPVNLHVKECKARVSHRLRALLSLLGHKREGRKYFEEIFEEITVDRSSDFVMKEQPTDQRSLVNFEQK